MSDPMWMTAPPGGYWDERDDEEPEDYYSGLSMADAVLDAAIEEALLRRAEKGEQGNA